MASLPPQPKLDPHIVALAKRIKAGQPSSLAERLALATAIVRFEDERRTWRRALRRAKRRGAE